jgi:hypothetical protein
MTMIQNHVDAHTKIYKTSAYGEVLIGYIDTDQLIYRSSDRQLVGRVDAQGRLFRRGLHDDQELGTFTQQGQVRSHGLFEGGDLGWVDPDGVVVQGGFILGENEVGRVDGPAQAAAAAALLLLFLPDDAEANRKLSR